MRQSLKSLFTVVPHGLLYISLFCGFFGIINVMQGDDTTALILLMCTLAATLLDEYLSKVAHTPRNEVGDQLALLNDLISFGIFTALMLYQLITLDARYVQVVVALFFGVCVYKTALFASKKLPKTDRVDIGLPLKSNAISVLLLSFLSFLGNGFVIICILLISAGILSSLKFPKLKI